MWDSGQRVRVTAGFINIFELLEAPRVGHSNPIPVLDIYQARKTVTVQRDQQWSKVIHGFLAFRDPNETGICVEETSLCVSISYGFKV